jgi:hypothetical protein
MSGSVEDQIRWISADEEGSRLLGLAVTNFFNRAILTFSDCRRDDDQATGDFT